VCRRSSTTCSTCRHFRGSLAADVGWCALDRRRRPLTGLEHRGCWTERPSGTTAGDPAVLRPASAADAAWRDLPVRGFIPVDGEPATGPGAASAIAPSAGASKLPSLDIPLAAVEAPEPWDARISLFGDLER